MCQNSEFFDVAPPAVPRRDARRAKPPGSAPRTSRGRRRWEPLTYFGDFIRRVVDTAGGASLRAALTESGGCLAAGVWMGPLGHRTF